MPVDYSKGLTSVSSGDYEAAISFFYQLTIDHKEDFFSYYYLAGALFQAGHFQQAIEALGWAIFIDPNNAQARYNRALALEKLEKYADAIAGLHDALALQPNYPQAQQALLRIQQRILAATPVDADTTQEASAVRYNLDGTVQMQAVVPQPATAPLIAAPMAMPTPGAFPLAQQYAGFVPGSSLDDEQTTLIDSFGDLPEALLSPRTYFQEQARYGGFMAPFWMYLALKLIGFIAGVIALIAGHGILRVSGSVGSLYNITNVTLVAICGWSYPFFMASMLAIGGLGLAKRKDFSGAFRVAVIASVPVIAGIGLLGILVPLIAPKPVTVSKSATTNQSNPIMAPGGSGSYGTQQPMPGNTAPMPIPPTSGSPGAIDQNAQIRAQVDKFNSKLSEMAASIKTVPPAPLWLVIPLILVQLALLTWFSVLIVMGCRILLSASQGGALATGIVSLLIYFGITIAIYIITMIAAESLLHTLQTHPGFPTTGMPQGGP
jgi:hypothetical protein